MVHQRGGKARRIATGTHFSICKMELQIAFYKGFGFMAPLFLKGFFTIN